MSNGLRVSGIHGTKERVTILCCCGSLLLRALISPLTIFSPSVYRNVYDVFTQRSVRVHYIIELS